MSDQSLERASRVTPPRKGEVINLTIDTTARAYDLRPLKLGRKVAPDANSNDFMADKVYLRLQAVTATVYFQFAPTNVVTLDKTATLAAGSTLAYANTYGDQVQAGTFVDVEIERDRDVFLHVQGSAAGTLVLRHTSEPTTSPANY